MKKPKITIEVAILLGFVGLIVLMILVKRFLL